MVEAIDPLKAAARSDHSALIQQIAIHLDADPAVLRLEPTRLCRQRETIATGKHNASFRVTAAAPTHYLVWRSWQILHLLRHHDAPS